jgi:hypothetical protein
MASSKVKTKGIFNFKDPAFWLALIAFGLAGYVFLQQSFAAPSPQGSCTVIPNPAKQYQGYTVNATGLAANRIYNFYVSDKVGTQWSSAQSDSSGNVSSTGYASYTGQYSVKLTDSTSKKRTVPTVATCSFEAQ